MFMIYHKWVLLSNLFFLEKRQNDQAGDGWYMLCLSWSPYNAGVL